MAKKGNAKKGIQWHPLVIKWCLCLRHQSNKAYETLRDSGCIALPSQRTLQDYSNAVKAGSGFSFEVDDQLLRAAHLMNSPSYHSLVTILIDEMYIREDLVYDKHTGWLIGFIDLGSINNHLARFEQSLSEDDAEISTPPLAKSMVVLMVRGLFTTLKFPYAQFLCSSLTGEQLFSPFWEAIFTWREWDSSKNINSTIVESQLSDQKLGFSQSNKGGWAPPICGTCPLCFCLTPPFYCSAPFLLLVLGLKCFRIGHGVVLFY